MLFLKACPKCQGDLVSSRTEPGERNCLQCGYVTYPTPPLPFVRERAGQGEPSRRMRRVA